MKRKFLCIACALIALVTAFSFGVSGCKEKDKGVTLLEENIIEDAYDNYYEIFAYSYCDSDGDGTGDLNGITQKLGYIRDMGYTGIWLMPINECSSYHGYDVTNYKSVNSKLGTVEDYKNLISAAHEKGIKVIIDLVVNHTSSNHPWFQSALAYKKGQGGEAKYAQYYNWAIMQTAGYTQSGSVWYESQFSSTMPDLNLDSNAVRTEIEDIMKYWLTMGTDGFRLDGCCYYYQSQSKSVEFCKWIKDTAVKYNENAYIVGEAWTGGAGISEFYESGCDSFFNFPAAGSGEIALAVKSGSAEDFWSSMVNLKKNSNGYVPAPFLSNHDNGVGRIASVMSRDEDKTKFSYGLLSILSGSTFTYYGDEIGMIGAHNDPDLRIGMLWDNDKTGITNPPPGTQHTDYAFDGVKEQLENSNSILNYYKVCNNARNAFPALMRGSSKRLRSSGEILAFTKTYGDQTITVVVNFGAGNNTVEDIEGTLAQSICVSGSVKAKGNALEMPKYSIAILT